MRIGKARILSTLTVGTSTLGGGQVLTVASVVAGMGLPPMTTTQRDAIATPTEGTVVYNLSTNTIDYYDGTQWITLLGGSTSAFTLDFTNADLAAGILTATHNLDQRPVLVQVYDNTWDMISPSEITLSDANTCDIDLAAFGTITGTWHLIVSTGGGTGAVPSGSGFAFGPAGSIPSPSTPGSVYLSTDYPVLYLDSGSEWRSFGPLYSFSNPPTTGWTQVNWSTNGGTTTVNQTTTGQLVMTDINSQSSEEGRLYTRPLISPNYRVTMGFLPLNVLVVGGQYPNCGLVLYDSVSQGRTSWTDINYNGSGYWISIGQWSALSGSGDVSYRTVWAHPSSVQWVRVESDGVNRNWYRSVDGMTWALYKTEAVGSFIVEDSYGIYVDSVFAPFVSMNVVSWKEEALP